jgi:chromosome segregation ATPase
VYKPTQPGTGLSEPTDRPLDGAPPTAAQPNAESAAREGLGPPPAEREATARTEEAMAKLSRALESVGSCLETLWSAHRGLSAEFAELRKQLDRRSSTNSDAEQQIAALQQALDESRRAAVLERERAANERERIFEHQDEFLTALLEEHEPGVESSPATTPASAASTPRSDDASELDRVRQMLEETQQKVSRLEAERERSREVLRRLQQQRDEAQRTATRLTQERRKQARQPKSGDATSSAARGPTAAKSKRPEARASQGRSEAGNEPPSNGPANTGSADPQSPLAAALANSDPSRRRRRRHKR